MAYLMGIDAGTTTIKAAIYNTNGEAFAVSSKHVNIEKPKPGWVEVDMYDVWEATKFVIKDSLQRAKIDAEKIASVGLSSQGGGIWLVDESGTPVRKAITWLDLRASNKVNDIKEKGLDKKIYDITWRKISTGSGLILLLWLKENEIEALKKARYYLSCKDWIKFCLTGTFSTDPTMMFETEPRKEGYSSEIFDILGIDEKYLDLFPPVIPAWKVAGTVNSRAAKETGLKEDTPVASGGYDVCSTALGAGVINDFQLFAVIGTAGIYAAVARKPIFDPNRLVSVNPHVVPNLYLFNCQSKTATVNLDWFINEFCKDLLVEAKEKGKNIYDICNELVSKVPPGANGVFYHPYLQGEIGPFVKPSARAMFTGISLWHKREHMLRAIYEGVGYSMLDNFQKICELLFPSVKLQKKEITVVGGGAQSEAWLQILADINNSTIIVPDGEEFGCRGAAINAGVAANLFKNHKEGVDAFFRIKKILSPRKEVSEKYKQLFEIYRKIYQSFWTIWEEIASLQAYNS